MANISGIWVSNTNTTATVTWTPVTENDTGLAMDMSHYPDRTVHVSGTFAGGMSVRIEGSNDGSTYVVLHDPQGNALDFTAAGAKLIAENTQLVRPRATAGASASTTIAIHGVSN